MHGFAWMNNPTDEDGPLLKHQLCKDSNVSFMYVQPLLPREAGRALSLTKMKWPGALLEFLALCLNNTMTFSNR